MVENLLLLKNVQYILPPDIDLTQNVVASKFNEKEDAAILSRCEKCGKVLESQYYLFVGIPPSSSVIKAIRCSNLNDEKAGVESVINMIRFEGKDFNIDSRYQWIFSDENIMNSKTRVCVNCYEEEYKEHLDAKDIHFIAIRIRTVYFAVEEYQRRHTPIDSAKSDIERYRISLPDRSMVALIGPGIPGWGFWLDVDAERGSEEQTLADFLSIALNLDYDTSNSSMNHDYVNSISQELRADFIQDKNRTVPNDQELTRWMKKYYGDPDDDSWIKAIEFCKVFTNPKTIFVHYIDKDWDVFNI